MNKIINAFLSAGIISVVLMAAILLIQHISKASRTESIIHGQILAGNVPSKQKLSLNGRL